MCEEKKPTRAQIFRYFRYKSSLIFDEAFNKGIRFVREQKYAKAMGSYDLAGTRQVILSEPSGAYIQYGSLRQETYCIPQKAPTNGLIIVFSSNYDA